MADLSIVHSPHAHSQRAAGLAPTGSVTLRERAGETGEAIAGRDADSVEFSAAALAALREAKQVGRSGEPEIRAELVARIKREIAEGTYETPEKLAAAAWKLTSQLEQGQFEPQG